MWTCANCGEKHEDQVTSCWRCGSTTKLPEPTRSPANLRWFHYVFAYLVSLLLSAGVGLSSGLLRAPEDFFAVGFWVSANVLAVPSFLALRPFLRRPIARWVMVIVLVFAWSFTFALLSPPRH